MTEWNRRWKIYWNELASDTYIYGSEIEFHAADDVEFRNALMPPGTIIKKWYSKVNFQAGRIEPALPIIDGEGRYHIAVDVESDVSGGILLRLLFLGKSGEEVESLFVDSPEMDFKCPLKAYSYEAQLICAGAHSFHFHSFTISESTESS
ncbi:MAG: accessory Sec system protein Asp3 [Clostridiales bacterium]|nr:accessory Sec system protein Asp3 [Clostridiales bacterium]